MNWSGLEEEKQPLLRLFFNDRRQFVSEPSKRERLLASVTNRVTDAHLANICELSKLERDKSRPLKTSLLRRRLKRRPQQKTPVKRTGVFEWSGRRDSDPRHQPWQGCALPLSYARIGRTEYLITYLKKIARAIF